jgi:hypothetical protein
MAPVDDLDFLTNEASISLCAPENAHRHRLGCICHATVSLLRIQTLGLLELVQGCVRRFQ